MARTEGPWAICHAPRPAARLRLACFPYAGGNAQTYRRWHQLLPDWIEVHAVHLSGRVPRMSEAPLVSISEIVRQVTPRLLDLPGDKPLALFGHSMGAVVAFEAARALGEAGRPVAHLGVSARAAPHLTQRRRLIHGLTDADFTEELRKMAGTPEEVLRDAELMELLLPALRADFTAIETYRPLGAGLLACNVSVFGGKTDPDVLVDDLLPWQDHTQGMALVEMMPGGHFFLDEAPAGMLSTLAKDLAHL